VVFWLALAALILLSLAGLVFAVVRGWQLFRQAKRTGRTVTGELERISRTGEQIQANLDRAQRAQADLQAALARLQASREKLDVQLAAVREARSAVATVIPLFAER
jgi:chromosome segregation ATPase